MQYYSQLISKFDYFFKYLYHIYSEDEIKKAHNDIDKSKFRNVVKLSCHK